MLLQFYKSYRSLRIKNELRNKTFLQASKPKDVFTSTRFSLNRQVIISIYILLPLSRRLMKLLEDIQVIQLAFIKLTVIGF